MTTLNDQSDSTLPVLRPRAADSHKGDFGRALLVGGSRGMSGAIALAGKSTLRSGAGLVTLAVPCGVQNVVASFEPSYMTHALDEENGCIAESAADTVIELSKNATAVALGPGLGRTAGVTAFVSKLYATLEVPLVVDADALFALAERQDVLERPPASRILTPHPGEFARLTGKPYDAGNRTDSAAALARRDLIRGTVVVLKGHGTVVCDGTRSFTNRTGNPGMATGGSGDVLTGVITGLLCQGLQPFDAARLGVHAHGLAGDLAAAELGEVSLIASDLVGFLPKAFQSLVR